MTNIRNYVEGMYDKIEDLDNQITELEEDNKNLHCCGNCRYSDISGCNLRNINIHNLLVCEKWEFDNYTNDERMEMFKRF